MRKLGEWKDLLVDNENKKMQSVFDTLVELFAMSKIGFSQYY